MKKTIYHTHFLLLLCFFTSFSLLGNNLHKGSISGIVRDATTQLELGGATVELVNKDKVAYTNELGVFSFVGLPAGQYTVQVSYLAYATVILEGVTVTDDSTQPLRINLEPENVNLPDVVISAKSIDPFAVISQLDIKTRPVNNGQELLRMMPGLFIAQHAGGGKAEQIFLRGFDIDHGTDLAIQVDGMPVNMVSHAHGQGYADLHFVIPEIIQSIDLRKGPYSARDGNFATAGAVELTTTNRLARSFAKAEAGSFDTYRLVSGLNLLPQGGDNQASAYIASEGIFTDGYFESPQNFYRINTLAKYHNPFDGRQRLTATFSAFSSRWDASGQIPQRAVDQGLITRFGTIDDTEGGQTSRINANIQHQYFLNPSTQIESQLFYSKYDFELYSNFTFFARDPVNGDQIRQKEDRHLFGYRSRVLKQSQFLGLPLNAELGWQLRFDRSNDNELSYTRNRTTTLENVQLGDITELNAAAYGEANLQLLPALRLQAGLRYDRFRFQYLNQMEPAYEQLSTSDGILSPKLSLFYQVTNGWQLYARAARGFHSNDTRLILAQEVGSSLPAGISYDLGALFRTGSRLVWQVNAWQLDLEQEFVYVGDEGVVEPSGETIRRGLEGMARWQIGQNFFADANLTYTHARSKTTDEADRIPLAPIWTSTGGLSYSPAEGWKASIRYRFLGDRPADEANSLTASGYFLLDANLGYEGRNYFIGLSAENILNEAWNEAQFATETRLFDEVEATEEIHFTPGTPFSLRGKVVLYF
ncbi:TonB-dependent receptor [Lewinella cohaerens]|uniref:TonB-dependent receptor n=1 Tax=Lewinella cohaerens TaxID=70995 RepID=UPI0003699539|nr:TonB-dependent receptor [Lewinella cohaerens]